MSVSERADAKPIRLGTVQQTLLTPLYSRALEFQRDAPIVRDEKAFEIVSRLDFDFSKIAAFRDTMTGNAIRASLLDHWIGEFLDRQPFGNIVLIGEGLDTTFDRNDNGQANWLEIDFPDVVKLRDELFSHNPRRRRFAGSVFQPDWSELVQSNEGNGENANVLFQIAGVTMYLEPEKVQALFTRLADEFPGCTVLFDTCSTLGKQNAGRWEATVRTTNAQYRFGIDDPSTIRDWDPRFNVTDTEALMDHHRNRWSLKTRLVSTFWRRLRNSYLVNRARFDGAS